MRLCRFTQNETVSNGFYFDSSVIPLRDAAQLVQSDGHDTMPVDADLIDYLPPAGKHGQVAKQLHDQLDQVDTSSIQIPIEDIQLLVPIPEPKKLFLLAGNYAKHIEEGGDIAAERRDTFPYVFMKPPTTTLTNPGQAIRIPDVSPNAIDWELELAVVIGRETKGVSEQEALGSVAGYTIVNDISNRRFRPNPDRNERPRDKFFDWLHGKWFDSFCPCGPCITTADVVPDPQTLDMKLSVNGEIRQQSSTSQQIFPVAAVIEFISSFVTLEPGDIISTGTPAGVGNTTGTYLKPGDEMIAAIGSIGELHSPVLSEK